MTLSEELMARGFINQHTSPSIAEILDDEKRVVYHGIDPSADSAQAGNFVNWMFLKHLQNHGHKIIFLVGGGTGMIGDPKSTEERPLSDVEEVKLRTKKIKAQAEKLFNDKDITFVNNHDWLSGQKLIEFLREIGKHFTVNELIKKEAIAERLGSENGISYTEFAYPLLQAYDYLVLNKEYGCDLQIGGSDQWGNMVAGVDLIRRLEQKKVHAITIPLVVDKTTGKKFGKSEGNAVWISAEKTSPYDFYQFWLNTADENVIDYLKLFTFLSLAEIESLQKEHDINPGKRVAQNALAASVTTIVHGQANTDVIKNVSELLFGERELSSLSKAEIKVLLENAPAIEVEKDLSILDVLVKSELASSKREARTFIESGAITLNNTKIESEDFLLTPDLFYESIAILKRGKRKYCLLTIKN